MIDPELRAPLEQLAGMPVLGEGTLTQLRELARTPATAVPAGREYTVPTADGAALPLTVLAPAATEPAACVFWIHGGGMVMGDRFSQIDIPLDWRDRFGAVVATLDYRLAPEVGGTTLVEDCYQGLCWVAEHAAELGVDPARIVVAGASGGGGLAAGVTLLARDRGAPAVAAQVLVCPMLDHRNVSVSSRQHTTGIWPREANAFGWRSVIGELADVPASISPALAEDLAGLPPTFVDVGSAEVFRDEAIDYAGRIWAAGGEAELHVWAGGFHGFDALVPQARISVTARRTRSDWLDRFLNDGV